MLLISFLPQALFNPFDPSSEDIEDGLDSRILAHFGAGGGRFRLRRLALLALTLNHPPSGARTPNRRQGLLERLAVGRLLQARLEPVVAGHPRDRQSALREGQP